jgi:sulfhydrogenase subunit delta
MEAARPRVAVHKFSSCDGCQLAFLNLGEDLLKLAALVEIVHFAEAGPMAPGERVDIAFVEGSVSTAEDIQRIKAIREESGYLVTIGACATAGGLQALRNFHDAGEWAGAVYPAPEQINVLQDSTPIKDHVRVDFELWGCPVNSRQLVALIKDRLLGVSPRRDPQPMCQECKRRQVVCTLVTRGEPCMGPVTQCGCGALCPSFGRACYACYGPTEQVNAAAIGRRFEGLGLLPEEIVQRFRFINSQAPAYLEAVGEKDE